MAQGGTLMRVMPATTPGDTLLIVIIGTSRAHRAGTPV
jgi:hypothetical protein